MPANSSHFRPEKWGYCTPQSKKWGLPVPLVPPPVNYAYGGNYNPSMRSVSVGVRYHSVSHNRPCPEYQSVSRWSQNRWHGESSVINKHITASCRLSITVYPRDAITQPMILRYNALAINEKRNYHGSAYGACGHTAPLSTSTFSRTYIMIIPSNQPYTLRAMHVHQTFLLQFQFRN